MISRVKILAQRTRIFTHSYTEDDPNIIVFWLSWQEGSELGFIVFRVLVK
jgi:hypothetical protein